MTNRRFLEQMRSELVHDINELESQLEKIDQQLYEAELADDESMIFA